MRYPQRRGDIQQRQHSTRDTAEHAGRNDPIPDRHRRVQHRWKPHPLRNTDRAEPKSGTATTAGSDSAMPWLSTTTVPGAAARIAAASSPATNTT
jgi:hypothetical protein